MDWLIPSAWAQAAGGAQPNAFVQLLPLVLIFVVFYFLLIRPQQAKVRAQREMLAGVPRAQALRQLARRVDVTSVTVFVSALVASIALVVWSPLASRVADPGTRVVITSSSADARCVPAAPAARAPAAFPGPRAARPL